MNDWKEIKMKPHLRDKNQFQRNVLMAIEAKERKQKKNLGWRIAASIIVMFSVGSYSWMELETYSVRSSKLTATSQVLLKKKEDNSCQYQISHLIENLKVAGFIIDVEKMAIQFSQEDVDRLKADNSPFISDVNQFIAGMEELYPTKYQKYDAGELVEFNSFHLLKDQRLCDWIR